MCSLFSQHYIALAVGTRLSARSTIILVVFGLTEDKLQFAVLAWNQPLRAFRALQQTIIMKTQDLMKINKAESYKNKEWKGSSIIPDGHPNYSSQSSNHTCR